MKRTILALSLSVLAISSMAQSAASNTSSNANVPVIIAPVFGNTPDHVSSDINYSGSYTAKTTGQVFLPGNAVASGGFNCGATSSLGAGVPGVSLGGSTAKSLKACVMMNLMNFAIIAKDKDMYESALCSMDEGREVMAEAGALCPSEVRARKSGAVTAVTPTAARPPSSVGTMNSMGQIVQ